MIKVIYTHPTNNPLEMFLDRQIRESGIEENENVMSFTRISINECPEIIEKYLLHKTHALIFLNEEGRSLYVFEGPFCVYDIKMILAVLTR